MLVHKSGVNNTSFGANVNINYNRLQGDLLFDKFFNLRDKQDLVEILGKVEKFSKMKEKSSVNIVSRLDNNQLNLVTTVEDKSGSIKTIINERSARKMVYDNDFTCRFLSNIKQAIVNVEVVRKELKKINSVFKGSESLVDNGFTKELPYYMLDNLKKGNNPTKRIIKILKRIEKENPKQENIISIKKVKKESKVGKSSKVQSYFAIKNKKGEKMVPLQYLMKDSIDSLFA